MREYKSKKIQKTPENLMKKTGKFFDIKFLKDKAFNHKISSYKSVKKTNEINAELDKFNEDIVNDYYDVHHKTEINQNIKSENFLPNILNLNLNSKEKFQKSNHVSNSFNEKFKRYITKNSLNPLSRNNKNISSLISQNNITNSKEQSSIKENEEKHLKSEKKYIKIIKIIIKPKILSKERIISKSNENSQLTYEKKKAELNEFFLKKYNKLMTTLKIKKKNLIRNKAFGKEQIEEICDSKRTVQLDKLRKIYINVIGKQNKSEFKNKQQKPLETSNVSVIDKLRDIFE